MNNITIPIKGMHCASCEILIGDELKKIPGVKNAKLNHKKGEAILSYDNVAPSKEQLKNAIEAAGYKIGKNEILPWVSTNITDYQDLAKAAGILLVVYIFARWVGIFNLDVGNESGGVLVALMVGLVAGVSTCMALIGGLVLGLSARHAELHPEATTYQKFRPHLYFNLGRIGGYALLGGLIGLVGSAFRLSSGVLGLLTMLVGGVMIFFGLKLIEIFPVLKEKNITLPTSIARLFGISSNVKEYSHKSAMVMGALTFFLPCGFTQAMQLYAVSTGSFWQGMTIMGLFAIGTAPGLLGIGGLTSVFKGKKARVFFMTAGLAVIILGWFNVANAGRLLQAGGNENSSTSTFESGDEQVIKMTESGRGYSPNQFTVQVNRPVKWVVNATSVFSCASNLIMPKYGIDVQLKKGENIIQFTPTEVGEIPFSCGMGMYTGKFIVVEKGSGSGVIPVAKASTEQVEVVVWAVEEDVVEERVVVVE